MRLRLRRGIQAVPEDGGQDKTNVLIIGVSKIGDGVSVIGKANTNRTARSLPLDPMWRIGDPIKSDPWKRINGS